MDLAFADADKTAIWIKGHGAAAQAGAAAAPGTSHPGMDELRL
jgi:hypothetical protein